MLASNDLVCTQCNSNKGAEVSLQVDRGGGLARFRVECERCGNFSRYIDDPVLRDALKRFFRRLEKYFPSPEAAHNAYARASEHGPIANPR